MRRAASPFPSPFSAAVFCSRYLFQDTFLKVQSFSCSVGSFRMSMLICWQRGCERRVHYCNTDLAWNSTESAVLRIRIRDPGLGAFLTPGSGIRDGRTSASGSGIRDEQPGSYFFELRNHFFCFFGVKILKFFDEDPGSGMEKSRIRDQHPGSPHCESGWEIRHLDPIPKTPLAFVRCRYLTPKQSPIRVEYIHCG